jgi:High potential iron-sulfur protein
VSKDDPKTSRRTILQVGAAAILAAGVASQAHAQQKIEKSLVMYQDKPKGAQQCSNCLHFQAPNACAIVDGEIAATGWCGAYAPKPT